MLKCLISFVDHQLRASNTQVKYVIFKSDKMRRNDKNITTRLNYLVQQSIKLKKQFLIFTRLSWCLMEHAKFSGISRVSLIHKLIIKSLFHANWSDRSKFWRHKVINSKFVFKLVLVFYCILFSSRVFKFLSGRMSTEMSSAKQKFKLYQRRSKISHRNRNFRLLQK